MLERRFITQFSACCILLIGSGCWVARVDDTAGTNGLPRVGLSAWVFATDASGPVNNVELMWAAVDPGDHFELGRATKESGPYENIYQGTGTSYKDYGLSDGTYFYQITADRNGKTIPSSPASISTMPMPVGLKTHSNETTNEVDLATEAVNVRDTCYAVQFEGNGQSFKALRVKHSSDGETWQDDGIVMDSSSNPDLADCKLESGSSFYDAIHDRLVYWGHFEHSDGYKLGQALVATARPGEPFTIHHIYNPLGFEVRDMSTFMDDDQQAYLVAASNPKGQNANGALTIFKMNSTCNDVVAIVARVMEKGYRESPHLLKHNGFYYLFFSQMAGWYPSQSGYVSSRSLNGPWSEPRTIGNTSTFSSQSGGIPAYGEIEPKIPVMIGNRWIHGEGTNVNVGLPLHFADGFAFYDFFPALLHDRAHSLIIPLDQGRLLSQNKAAQSSIAGKPGHEAALAFDGDYNTTFESDDLSWPFDLTTDLGSSCNVRNVQISWFMVKGSEGFYTYTIEGSADGKTWTTLLDHTNAADDVISKTYGFTSDELPTSATARYLKVSVKQAHLHNNPKNWYPPTIYEIKVYGGTERPN